MRRGLVAPALIALLALIAILLVYSGALGGPPPSPSPSPTPTASPTRTPTRTPTPRPTLVVTSSPSPSPTPVDAAVVASAVVIPLRSAELASPNTGIVDVVLVREHQPVAADQLLVRLDQSSQLAAIDVAEADVARAEVAVERARLGVEQLPPGASADLREAAEAELRLAEAELEVARSTLAAAQVALRQTELRAPFAGTVAAVDISPGEQAVAGEPIVTIADLSAWLIETTDLSELDVVRIAVGDRARVTFDALPDLVLTGTVDRIQVRGTSDDGGVNFAVVLQPDEDHPKLRWNMTATVRITPDS